MRSGASNIFRDARLDDIPALHRVRMAARENRLTSTVLTDGDYVRAVADPCRTWVIEADGQIVAFATADSSTGNIWALFVDPEHEGRGYGRRLHDAMVTWLWERGVDRAWLTTTPRTRAHRFYVMAGWTLAGPAADGEIRLELTRSTAFSFSSIPTRRGHFRLESGHHSDLWMTLEALCSTPSTLRSSIDALAARLRRHSIDVACGPLNEGAFVALMVAQELGCGFAYADRFVRSDHQGLFPIEYRLPRPQQAIVEGKRVAIVNDVTSAGSAVRGTYEDLNRLHAKVVAIGSLLVLGDHITAFGRERHVEIETLQQMAFNSWLPADCPLCRDGLPLEDLSG